MTISWENYCTQPNFSMFWRSVICDFLRFSSSFFFYFGVHSTYWSECLDHCHSKSSFHHYRLLEDLDIHDTRNFPSYLTGLIAVLLIFITLFAFRINRFFITLSTVSCCIKLFIFLVLHFNFPRILLVIIL